MKSSRQPVKLIVLLALLCSFLFASCKHHNTHVVRGFYYWKSSAGGLYDGEKQYIDSISLQKLYVKLFEVKHSDLLGNIPAAKTMLSLYGIKSLENKFAFIPVVFIRNDIFAQTSTAGLDSLADNIVFLINKYYYKLDADSGFKEIQIDCDWTAGTKDKYFYLLKAIKKVAGKTISCTLRLYPYKYPEKMGVPPVDKAMLMCYNLISPLGNQDKNSILDVKELGAYLNKSRNYPLHLDIALPIYSWMQLYQNNRFAGIIYHDNNALLSIMKPTKPLWYEVTRDTVVDELYIRRGDEIKYELVTAENIRKSIGLIKENVNLDDTTTVTFFHLDEDQLKQYSYATLDSIYSAFGR